MLENSLKLAVQTGKVVFGHDKTVKMAREKKVKLIVVASNYRKDSELTKNIFNDVPVLRYPGTNVELGRICGKKFSVSVLGIIDPGNSNILNEKA